MAGAGFNNLAAGWILQKRKKFVTWSQRPVDCLFVFLQASYKRLPGRRPYGSNTDTICFGVLNDLEPQCIWGLSKKHGYNTGPYIMVQIVSRVPL